MEEADTQGEADTPENRLASIITQACLELKLPDEYIDHFSQDVSVCLGEEQQKNTLYDARKISNKIKDYALLVREEPPGDAQTLHFEIHALASLTATYFLAREAALKDEKLAYLLEQEEGGVH